MRKIEREGRLLRLGSAGALAFILALAVPASLRAQSATTAPAGAQVTFAKDIAPIFQERCQQCHRTGQMAPMSLVTYQDARPWARSIRAKVSAGEMPPWFLDRTVGIQKFKNDYSITPEQRDTIVRWVDQGALPGDPKDMPPPKVWPSDSGYRLADRLNRPPDLIIKSPPYKVLAQGPDQWWEPIVATNLKEDRWVQAIEMKPGDRRVVHHSGTYLYQDEDVAVLEAEEALRRGRGNVEALMAAMKNPSGKTVPATTESSPAIGEWAVGKEGEIYADNTGKLMKAGARIGYRTHYHSVGEEITDSTEAAFWFYPKGYVPQRIVRFTSIGGSRNLQIPPNSESVHHGYTVLPTPAIIQNFQPHMHLRGKAFALEAILPNGEVQVLNYSERFDFNWSVNYIYDDDVAPVLPKGTVIHGIAWHDNTTKNKQNPDPRQWVVRGERSVDEMAHMNAQLVYITQEDYDQIMAARAKQRGTSTTAQQQQQQQ